jgi:hypothetical protein
MQLNVPSDLETLKTRKREKEIRIRRIPRTANIHP